MTQVCFAAQKADNAPTDPELSLGPFKHMYAAEFISKYVNFLDRSYKGRNNKITDGIRSGDGHLDIENGHIGWRTETEDERWNQKDLEAVHSLHEREREGQKRADRK